MDVQFLGHTDSISRSIEEMEALRQSTHHGKLDSSSPGVNPNPNQQGQGLVALLVMVAVLCFIMTYCCWGAPCCRAFCRRYCCCQMNLDPDLETSPSAVEANSSTPTIILLPFGRMLVVDGNVFAQLQADTTGLDLIELGESVVRAQQRHLAHTSLSFTDSITRYSSTPSILDIDSETGSKYGMSPTLGGHAPPPYDSLFGSTDLPPSYSEIWRHVSGLALSEHESIQEGSASQVIVSDETEEGSASRVSFGTQETCRVEEDREESTCSVVVEQTTEEIPAEIRESRV